MVPIAPRPERLQHTSRKVRRCCIHERVHRIRVGRVGLSKRTKQRIQRLQPSKFELGGGFGRGLLRLQLRPDARERGRAELDLCLEVCTMQLGVRVCTLRAVVILRRTFLVQFSARWENASDAGWWAARL